MVLCKHFQSGSCRFGSKCNNEHIDIKQLVKNDTEGAINGKQFPFSCYGPFKDKPSIPNFIEDQSFEEVRLLCYEARRNNQFELFHQQYSMGFAEAMNKLKALLQPSYELMNVLFMMYDSPAVANGGNGSNSTSTDASSIFGKSTTINNGGSVFAGSNIFGGGTNTNNTAGSIFGGQTNIAAQQQQTSIFGQQQQQQQQPAQQPQQQGNSGSIFGGLTKPSLFGQQQTTATAGTGFGLFAQAAQQSGLFNQPSTFGQQQQQPTGFVQNSFTVQPVQQTIGGTFQAHQPQTQNMFGQNIQQNPQPVAMGSNIFAQAMQQNIAAAPTNGGGFFQQDGAGGFTQQQQQQQQQMLQQQQMMSQQQQTNQMQNTVAHNSVYSNLSDLTADEIDAFRADFFEPGRLPISPPPLELLN